MCLHPTAHASLPAWSHSTDAPSSLRLQLYKFNFYQSKFDRLVMKGKAKEAIEVMVASESEIQARRHQSRNEIAKE